MKLKDGKSRYMQDGNINALARALSPVARLCMKSGMGAGELLVAVKIACIGVAAENAKLGNRLNNSRISAATGLTRKEVRTLSGFMTSGKVIAGRDVSRQRTARVLHGWRTDPEYLDHAGHPLPLVVRGAEPSFHSLVRRYGGDVTPVSVLNELIRTGAVTRLRGGQVAVRKTTARIKGFSSEVIAEVAARLHDIGDTLVHNIENTDQPLFTGYSEIANLPPDEAALFQATFSERAAALVDGVGRWHTSQARVRARAKAGTRGDTRVGVGVYLVNQRTGTARASAGPRTAATVKRRS